MEGQVDKIMQDQNGDLPEIAATGYSTTTYIMMGVGILAVAAIGMAALAVSAKEKLMKSWARQTRSNQLAMMEARKAARTNSLELGLEADSIVVAHCENKEDKKRVKMLVL